MKKILFADGCVYRETSKTERLAQAFLERFRDSGEYTLETVVLENTGLAPLNGESLKKRTEYCEHADFPDDFFRYAKMFAEADEVVIAVPYWDLNYPSYLKVFLEHLCVCGLTFRYSDHGPVGLTRVKKVTYITTAGGYIGNCNFGFDYVKSLMKELFKIPEVGFIYAEGLDIEGNDPEAILNSAIRSIQKKTKRP